MAGQEAVNEAQFAFTPRKLQCELPNLRSKRGSPWQRCLATLSGHVSQLMESEPTEAELAAFMADEEVVLELQSLQGILASSPALANPHPEIVAGVKVAVRVQAVDPEGSRQRVVAQRVQEAVKSTPETAPPEATPPEATPSDPGWLTEMFSELDEGNTGALSRLV